VNTPPEDTGTAATAPLGKAGSGPQIAAVTAGSATVRGMAWMAAGGFALCAMNALMRVLTLEMSPPFAQFLRYLFAVLVMLPLLVRNGPAAYRPRNLKGQFWRGIVHTASLSLFFLALPHLPLADVTAIMFTTPIFVLVGAALLLNERVSGARWAAALIGFVGVFVVLWPHLSGAGGGWWSLVMLAASPLFAGSFLINKALTRHDPPGVIVMWQNATVTLFTLPLALPFWQTPTLEQTGLLLVCGLLGTVAHLCMTRAFTLGDISAMQPMRFLDLIWASLFGLLLFGNVPAATALLGGAVIVASTVWIARRESAR